MDLVEACNLLGIAEGCSEKQVQIAFHELMRVHHPDVASVSADRRTANIDPAHLTEAYSVVVASIRTSPDGQVSIAAEALTETDLVSSSRSSIASDHDGDTIWIEAPPDEAYQRLLEAAAALGGIGHVDRTLGLLEVIVRFEGGPSCSVLMTLQGRSHGTDVFCEMESIEAEQTPSIQPVLDALVEQLQTPG
jgi:hypothetical protein